MTHMFTPTTSLIFFVVRFICRRKKCIMGNLISSIPEPQTITSHQQDLSMSDTSIVNGISKPLEIKRYWLNGLLLKVTKSSELITITWKKPLQPPIRITRFKIVVHLLESFGSSDKYTQLYEHFFFASLANDFNCSWGATPGQIYGVTCLALTETDEVVSSGKCIFRADFSKTELQKLYLLGTTFCGARKHRFLVVYRCKPKQYWQNINTKDAGIMKPYQKDDNGHAANHINRCLDGLFFSAQTVFGSSRVDTSPFGDTKFVMMANFMLDPAIMNLYFCDFYCNATPSTAHYVTIVVCVKGSPSDQWCAKKLISLPPRNAFIEVKKVRGVLEFYVNSDVWVELYYTESIDLNRGYLEPIMPIGYGSSKAGGIPNNKACKLCNI